MNTSIAETLTPRERRSQRTRSAILEAALDIISREGIGALSMRRIAREIDYSPSALYDYFKSKDDIISALCHRVDERLAGYLNQADDQLPPAARLVEIGMNYLRFARENEREYAMLFRTPTAEANQQPAYSAGFQILLTAVGDVQAADPDQPESLDQQAFAYSCWAFVHGMASLSNQVKVGQDMDTVHRAALNRFVRLFEPES